MKNNCQTVWKKELSRQKLAKITPCEQQNVEEKAQRTQQEANNRKLLFARGLKTRSTFYAPSLMTNAYPTEEQLKARKKDET